jgi:hypothetical protein
VKSLQLWSSCVIASLAIVLPPRGARAQQHDEAAPPRVPIDDPTGGAYTSPTLLLTPAGAVPVWNVRITASSEFQGPSQSSNEPTADASIRPGLGVELGLPLGITAAAGTNWVGGDVDENGAKKFSLGLSPFFQARLHLYGDKGGQGLQLGTSVTYKFVGFDGDPGEMEIALSSQYRRSSWEAGLQAVGGKDFASTDADVELHAYALYRVIPNLGLGAAAQGRYGVVTEPGASRYDTMGGGLVSWTVERYQLGALIGWSTINLDQGHFGALGQLFASARF